MGKIVLTDGRTVESPEQLFTVMRPVKLVKRIRAVPVAETVSITEQGRQELEEIQASRTIETEVDNG